MAGSALWQRALALHRAYMDYRAALLAHADALTATGAALRRQNEVYARLLAMAKATPLTDTLPEQAIDLQAEIVVFEAELALARHREAESQAALGAASSRLDELTSARQSRW